MQTKAQKALYLELEQIAEPVSSSKNNPLKSWLTRISYFLSNAMTPSSEPKVWCSKDWFGHTWWNIYLPRTGQTVRLSSEEEVRIWLDEHLHVL